MLLESPIIWAIVGVTLIVAEFFTLNFVLVFFGGAALIVSALAAQGTADGLVEQLTWFSGISVGSILWLRRSLSRWFTGRVQLGTGREDDTGLLNRRGEVTTAFVKGAGKVLIGGTNWDATSDAELAVGDTVRVTGRSGITLRVEPVER